MSSSSSSPPEQLSRHDARLVTESFLSVQATVSELVSFFRELVAPSDGTPPQIVEMLTPTAVADLRSLQVAVRRFVFVVDELEHYAELYGDKAERGRERAEASTLVNAVAQFVERLSIKHRLRQFDEGAAFAATDANAASASARELEALVRRVAESFGYRDGSSLVDDDDASSSEDSDYAPEHDDDDGKDLVVEDDEPESKRAKVAAE